MPGTWRPHNAFLHLTGVSFSKGSTSTRGIHLLPGMSFLVHGANRPLLDHGWAVGLVLGCFAGWAQENLVPENVDHAGIISRWDAHSLGRGQQLFQVACAPCHGTNGVQTVNP